MFSSISIPNRRSHLFVVCLPSALVSGLTNFCQLIRKYRRWSWLGHVQRMPEHRLVRRVLLNSAKPTHETLFADVPNLNVDITIRMPEDRSCGEVVDPHSVANRFTWTCTKPRERTSYLYTGQKGMLLTLSHRRAAIPRSQSNGEEVPRYRPQ